MVFIRAPKIERVGPAVKVLATEGDDPVVVRQDRVMAATFHPELSDDTRVHQAFVDMVRNGKRNPLLEHWDRDSADAATRALLLEPGEFLARYQCPLQRQFLEWTFFHGKG